MVGLNNPFNIRANGINWLGLSGSLCGFCSFKEMKYGIRAACILIMRTYRKKNVLTIYEIINRYAPKSENDTNRYIRFVCGVLGCFPFDIPRVDEYPKLLNAMSIFEGNKVSIDDIVNVINEFNIKPYKKKIYEAKDY